jgi:putative nucleotidyltransferase with HDIG domain
MLHVDVPAPVHELDEVPTDRRVALRLLWLLDDPHAPLDAITQVISADPGLSARVLALANRSLDCEAGGIVSLPRAVSLLRAAPVQAVACTAVLNLFSNRPELPDEFWLHAMTSAVAAARVAFHMHMDPAEALTVGLLHDFGEQLMRGRDPERFEESMQSASADDPEARLARERQLFGLDHAMLGAQVLASHGLPSRLTETVHDHHDPRANTAPLTRVIRVADCIAKIIEGDDLDLDATLRATDIDASGARLIEQTETDRLVLINFLAADFQAPRSVAR